MKKSPIKFVLTIILAISIVTIAIIASVVVYINKTEPAIVAPEGFEVFKADNFYFFYPDNLTLYTPDTTATYPVDKSKTATYLGQIIDAEPVLDKETGKQIIRQYSDNLKIAFIDLGEMTFEEYLAKENAIREKEDNDLTENSDDITAGEYKGKSYFENSYAKWNITIDYMPNTEGTQVVVIEATISPDFKEDYRKMLESLKFRESFKSKLNISEKLKLDKNLARMEDSDFPFNFYYPINLSYCMDNGSTLVVPAQIAIKNGEPCAGGITENDIYIYASYGEKIKNEGLTIWTENYSARNGNTFELKTVLSNFKFYSVASSPLDSTSGSMATLVFQNVDKSEVLKMLDLVKLK